MSEGNWNGSGVDLVDFEREFNCRDCAWEGETTGYTEDGVILTAECPNCKAEIVVDLESERESEFWDSKPDFD